MRLKRWQSTGSHEPNSKKDLERPSLLSKFLKVQELYRCVSVLFTILTEKVDSAQKCVNGTVVEFVSKCLNVTAFCVNLAAVGRRCKCYRCKVIQILNC